MAIISKEYREFLDEIDKAEVSGRKFHCEYRDGLQNRWITGDIRDMGPDGGTEYKVIYDPPPEPPAAKPLEGWARLLPVDGGVVLGSVIYSTEAAARKNAVAPDYRTVRVREVPTPTDQLLAGMEAGAEVLADPTPNPLAEAWWARLRPVECFPHHVGTIADRPDDLHDIPVRAIHYDENGVEIESEEVEKQRARGDEYQRDWGAERDRRMDAEREVVQLRSLLAKTDAILRNLTTNSERLLTDKEQEVERQRAQIEQLTAEVVAGLPVVKEAEREVEYLREENTRLKVDLELERAGCKALRAERDKLAAERDRLTRRLAVYEGMVEAASKGLLRHWARANGVDPYTLGCNLEILCARRCQELAGEVK